MPRQSLAGVAEEVVLGRDVKLFDAASVLLAEQPIRA